MELKYSGRNITVTDSLKDVAEKKLSRLDKFFNTEVVGSVLFSADKNRRTCEVTLKLPEGTYIRSEQSSDDMYNSIDSVIKGLEAQITKHKSKLKRRFGSGAKSIRFENIEDAEDNDKLLQKIVKKKAFDLRPMDSEEAIMQMELLGHNFFVFLQTDLETIGVVYRRNDGNYGLLEPNM